MPSLSDRQEVARRLRVLDCKIRSTDTLESACNNLMQATYGIDHPFSPIEFSVRNLCGLAIVLADLIDPTCELDLDFCMEYIVCQSCGYELPHGTHLDEIKYCPNCGSRVVVSEDA